MKKIDISVVPSESGGTIPKPFDEPCIAQSCRRLARFAGLTRFGVNVTAIEAGAWSSQRHWLSHEDEFVWVLEGELTLVTDAGEETLRAGDCAAFKSGDPDGGVGRARWASVTLWSLPRLGDVRRRSKALIGRVPLDESNLRPTDVF